MFRPRFSWKLNWLLTRELLPFSIIPFIALTTLVFIQQAGKYFGIVLSFHTPAQAKLAFLGSLIPGIIVITLPVALLLGAIISCSRLSADGELTAAQSSGISPMTMALPLALIGLLATGFAIHLSTKVAPRALKSLKALRTRILLQEASAQVTPRAFTTRFPGLLVYIRDVDPKTGDWLGVFLLQRNEEQKFERLLTAERGQLRVSPSNNLEVQLYGGLSLESKLDSPTRAASAFAKSSIKPTKETNNADSEASGASLSEMSLSEVRRVIKSAASDKERVQAKVEWHKRLAFPFACMTLPLMAFVIVLRGKRLATRPRTAVSVIFVALLFYVIMVAGQSVATSGRVPTWLGVWLAHLLYSLFILYSFAHTNRTALSWPNWSEMFRLRTPVTPAAIKDLPQQRVIKSRFAMPSLSPLNLINYLLVSEIAKYYLIAVAALVTTSIAFTLFDLIPSIVRSGTSFSYAASYFAYLIPQLAYYVSPFALLVAILMGCSVLARTNQLIVLAGAGQSKLRLVAAILIAVLLAGVGLWAVSDSLLPFTNREQDVRYHKIKNRQLEQTIIAFGKKWVIGQNGAIYGYQQIDEHNALLNTTVYYLNPSTHLLDRALEFEHAAQIAPDSWQATGGSVKTVRPDLTVDLAATRAPGLPFSIPDGSGIFKRTVNESSKMSTAELRAYINQLQSIGAPTIEPKLDLRKRLAFPFSCLTVAILALPFALGRRARRYSPVLSVAVSIAIGLFFWLLMTIFEAAGKQSNLPVSVAVWAPQVLFLAIGLYLNFRQRVHS
jgi:LPS export ABC transporter permease LptG